MQGILSPKQVLLVHRIAVATPIAADRAGLLSRIPAGFVHGLPTASSPAAQLLSDLHELNIAGRLADGSVPLEVWLTNASALLAGVEQVNVVQEALKVFRETLEQVRRAVPANADR